jgi:hypothetical protein
LIRIASDSLHTGDTTRLVWEIPVGSKVLRGPTGSDSLLVRADTGTPPTWTLQPLAPSGFGGDTLLAVAPTGDTLREAVPPWSVASRIQGSDSAAAPVLPPQAVPVPFPWDLVGWGALVAVLAGLAVWAFLKRRRRKPAAPVAPPRDPVDEARARLEALVSSSESGRPPRETAFECGELLRELHGGLHGWTDSVESTSREWLDWTAARRTDAERAAVAAFLEEADSLRYADSAADARRLVAEARLLLEAIARHRTGAAAP